MSKLNLNPMADWGYVNNSRFRFLSIRNQGGGVEPVPPEPVIPTDRILYTVVAGGTKPESRWITENCSDNVFDTETGEGYLVLNSGVTELTEYYDEEADIDYTIFIDINWDEVDGDTNILSLTIPKQITSIGDYCFSCYYNLESVTIPDSVTIIVNDAFYNCNSLISVTCLATYPPTLGVHNFGAANDTLYVPADSVQAYLDDTDWNTAFNGNIQAI